VGLASLVELEDARRTSLAAQTALVSLQQERMTAWIALYRAWAAAGTPARPQRQRPLPRACRQKLIHLTAGRPSMQPIQTPFRSPPLPRCACWPLRARCLRPSLARRQRREGRAGQRPPASGRHGDHAATRTVHCPAPVGQRQCGRLAGGQHGRRKQRPAPDRPCANVGDVVQGRPGAGHLCRRHRAGRCGPGPRQPARSRGQRAEAAANAERAQTCKPRAPEPAADPAVHHRRADRQARVAAARASSTRSSCA
jgi:hypothetical protein